MLKEHDAVPAWSVPDHTGTMRSSSEFLGTWTILYFYPEDDTPGCTKEACGFRDSWASLKDKAHVLGVSADSVENHQKFIEKYELPFTLLADTDRTLINLLGADGTTYPERVTFLIDPKGTIAKIYQKMDTAAHAQEIEHDLDTLITA